MKTRVTTTRCTGPEGSAVPSTRIVNGLILAAQNGISLLGIVGLVISFNGLLALVLLLAALPGALTA